MVFIRQEGCTQTVTNMDSYATSHPSTSLHSMFMRIFMLASIAKDSEEFRAPGALSVMMMMKTGP